MQNDQFNTGVIRGPEVFKEAWELMKDQYWLIFGITIVGMLVGSAVPVVIIGPMMCGIYLCLLDKMDGREVKFDRLFKGFEFFGPSLIVAIVIMVPMIVLLFAIYIPMIAVAMAGPRMSESEVIPLLIGTVLFEIVVAFIMVCFHTLLIFSFPLIADRKLGGFDAMKVSAKAVWHNLGGIASMIGVSFVVAMGGYLLLCIGVYLALPLIMMSWAVAYRKVFPKIEDKWRHEPPPISSYGQV
ncbi:MAG: hypothetical protein ABL959_08150 [Pyrinomonadaceae bacterium]